MGGPEESMLPSSLTGRLVGLGALVCAVLLAAAALLLSSSEGARQSFLWVTHTDKVIREVDELVGDVREAESGQRGFLLTRSAVYLDSFNERLTSAERHLKALGDLVADNRAQSQRVSALSGVLAARLVALRTPVTLAQRGRFDEAIAFVASGRGRTLMEEVGRRADEIKAAEQTLLTVRVGDAETRARWNHDLILFGGPLIAVGFLLLVLLLDRSLSGSLKGLLQAIRSIASGDVEARAARGSRIREIDRLADAYNAMADRLADAATRQADSDRDLQAANGELRARGDAIELLGGMAHRMQASRTDEELAEVLRCFLPRVLPEVPGALYVHNNSRNLLCRVAEWGEHAEQEGGLPDNFAPDACWALRRGQGHTVTEPGRDVRCRHVSDDARYHCEPVLAGGEVVGLLYLEGEVTARDRFRLAALTENIALALVNQRLQRGLREQSIRDPLTGLFNRRYMEETLATEVARAHRSGQPLGVIMCDVDHFKRFNDDHGHAAGDAVLQVVAGALQRHFRDGDVVCRYGGEEFAVIAPTGDLERLQQRAEELRAAIKAQALRHDGRTLRPITMSLGLTALMPGQTGEDVVAEADAALYRAKQEGRDRVVTTWSEPRLAA